MKKSDDSVNTAELLMAGYISVVCSPLLYILYRLDIIPKKSISLLVGVLCVFFMIVNYSLYTRRNKYKKILKTYNYCEGRYYLALIFIFSCIVITLTFFWWLD